MTALCNAPPNTSKPPNGVCLGCLLCWGTFKAHQAVPVTVQVPNTSDVTRPVLWMDR